MTTEIALVEKPLTESALRKLLTDSVTLPDRFESFADVVATIKVGQELGIPPLTALNELFVVAGQVSMSAKMAAALARRQGAYFHVKQEPGVAHVTVSQVLPNGDMFDAGTYSFTTEDAERAGLVDSTPAWKGYPQDMLVNRAMTRAVKFAFPQAVVGGFGPVEIKEGSFADLEVDPVTGEIIDTNGKEEQDA
jgi:hypothetical protein